MCVACLDFGFQVGLEIDHLNEWTFPAELKRDGTNLNICCISENISLPRTVAFNIVVYVMYHCIAEQARKSTLFSV